MLLEPQFLNQDCNFHLKCSALLVWQEHSSPIVAGNEGTKLSAQPGGRKLMTIDAMPLNDSQMTTSLEKAATFAHESFSVHVDGD